MVTFIGIDEYDFMNEYAYLYRYVTFDRLLEQLEKKTIAFLNPASWDDPYEKYYIEREYIIGGKAHQLPIKDKAFCICMSGTLSSDAFWKVYAPKENGVRLRFNTVEFLRFLNSLKSCEIYIGKVTYETTKVFSQLKI
jgi:hypothetical protein